MSNALYGDRHPAHRDSNANQKPPATGTAPGPRAPMKDGNANWPGLPGKSQPKDRSRGTTRVKSTLKRMGL